MTIKMMNSYFVPGIEIRNLYVFSWDRAMNYSSNNLHFLSEETKAQRCLIIHFRAQSNNCLAGVDAVLDD